MQQLKDIYVFFGPPGSGKGSLSQLCQKRLGFAHVAAGNLLRQHIVQGTELGKQIAELINAGKLVDDILITSMIEQWIVANMLTFDHLILDGFPRTVAQAATLDSMIAKMKSFRLKVVVFKVDDKIVVSRMKQRLICSNSACQEVYSVADLENLLHGVCRECSDALIHRRDDQEELMYDRLRVYHDHEKEILNYYKEHLHGYYEIDATQPLESVFNMFQGLLHQGIQR